MFNEKCCLMCIFYATKKNCIGIRKNFCVRHQMRAVPGNICEYYIRDYKKVMHYNNFRYTRDNESKHTCEYCETVQASRERQKNVYIGVKQ